MVRARVTFGATTSALAVVAVALSAPSSTGDLGDAKWPTLGVAIGRVRAPEYEHAIDELEHPDQHENDVPWYDPNDPDDGPGRKFVERRGDVVEKFRQRVLAEGDALIRAAIEVLLHDDALEDRRRAQLLLAQFPRLPRWAIVKLEGSERFDAWALTQLSRRSDEDFTVDRLGDEPQEGWWNLPDPLESVEGELRDLVAYPAQRVDEFNDEYRAGYRDVALPILDHLAKHVDWNERVAADLDGDGDLEHVVACNFWKASVGTGWNDELSFVALVDRASPNSAWHVTAFERLDRGEVPDPFLPHPLLARDFDRDGQVEVAVRTRFTDYYVGRCRIVAAGATAPLPCIGAGGSVARVVVLERSIEEPTRFVDCDRHVTTTVGTWGELVGALACERQCHEWRNGAFVDAELLYTPMR